MEKINQSLKFFTLKYNEIKKEIKELNELKIRYKNEINTLKRLKELK